VVGETAAESEVHPLKRAAEAPSTDSAAASAGRWRPGRPGGDGTILGPGARLPSLRPGLGGGSGSTVWLSMR